MPSQPNGYDVQLSNYDNRRTVAGGRLTPGYNVDKINVAAGIKMLKEVCGYTETETVMVIEYALRRWARGEEDQAQRGAIDKSFHGIDLTSWKMVLAAAMAGAQGEE